ncbi:MAG: hypothetical protein HRT35_29015 [Algicola sp.]|nr:hypothetical protein [Algicola sp.]
MTEQQKAALITQSWQMHEIVEQCYLDDPAAKGEGTTEKNEAWSEKQRLLLADMALHLLQTALNPGEIKLDKLTNNLHSIMTIADQYLPDAELVKATEKLW